MENTQFTINSFFNNLPIRIIGSPEEPFFYASDIGDILGIKQISVSVKNFDETEIATPEVRRTKNLVTYRKYKDELRRDDSVTLLTEYGVYRLILCSRSAIAKEFKAHIYQLIKNARLAEREKLHIISKDDFAAMHKHIQELEKNQAEYKKYNPTIFVFKVEICGNPYNHIPTEFVDKDIARYFNESWEYLYKFTTEPDATDYTLGEPIAKIYGNSEQIMEELLDEALEIVPSAHSKYSFHENFDFDIMYGKIIYN